MDPDVSLRPDQVQDLAALIANKRHGMGHEPACGKTPTACVLQWYLQNELSNSSVWTVPKSLLGKNRDELLRFTHFTRGDLQIVEREDQIARPGAKVLLMSFERFRRSYKLIPAQFRSFLADEFHMGFKGAESARTKAMFDFIRRRDAWFVPMTGTLIDGKIETAFPAIHAIEPRYYGSWRSFQAYHVITDLYGNRIGIRNTEKLTEILKRHFTWRTFAEIHGPEAKVIFTELVDMNPRQRKHYDEFASKALLELDQFFVDGTLPGVALARARQIMEHPNHFPNLVGEGFVDICPGETPGKQDRIEVHLTDAKERGQPLVIFAALKAQQRALFELSKRMGRRAALINSDTSGPRRREIDLAFQAAEIDDIICSPACAGVGFNWQLWGKKEVRHIIMASLDYLDSSFIQAYRRFIRGKRQSPLRITVLEYRNSLDQHLFGLLHKKSKEAARVDGVRQILDLTKTEEFLPT